MKKRPQTRYIVRLLLATGFVYSVIWWLVGSDSEAIATAISFAVGLLSESVI